MEESKQTPVKSKDTEVQPLKVVSSAPNPEMYISGTDPIKDNTLSGGEELPPHPGHQKEELPEIKLYAEEIYPRAKRPKFMNWFVMLWYVISFQCSGRLLKVHIALDASEVQTRRMVAERMEMGDVVNKLERQQQRSGLHLQSEFFIPQYAGAKQHKIEEEGQMTGIYYTLGDLRLVKGEGAKWLIANKKTGNSLPVELENLYIGIVVLRAMGADINFETVMGDNPAMKELQEKLGKNIELG